MVLLSKVLHIRQAKNTLYVMECSSEKRISVNAAFQNSTRSGFG